MMFVEVDGYYVNINTIESISPLWGRGDDQQFLIKSVSGKEHRFYQSRNYNSPNLADIHKNLINMIPKKRKDIFSPYSQTGKGDDLKSHNL